MTFPIIGIIADEIVRTSFTQNADQLGIGINFIQKETSTEKIIELSKNCDFLCVDPTCVPTSSLRSIESILVTRSPHAQISTWPITLITDNLSITPAPAISEEQASEIQLAAIKLVSEIRLIGGVELIVDANDFRKLISINWTNPSSGYAFDLGSTTNYFEQYLRSVLDLPLGDTHNLNSFIVSGNLNTDPKSDDYRPYLHLMARNPKLKFNQSIKKVGIIGNNLDYLLTEIYQPHLLELESLKVLNSPFGHGLSLLLGAQE